MGLNAPAVIANCSLFRLELVNIIVVCRDLTRLIELIDWAVFDREFVAQCVATGLRFAFDRSNALAAVQVQSAAQAQAGRLADDLHDGRCAVHV